MKYLDKVKLLIDRENYSINGLKKGDIGRIIAAEIRDDELLVCFIDPLFFDKSVVWTDETIYQTRDDIITTIKIEDLEVIEESDLTDEDILKSLPSKDKRWWCKVENGFILNLLGEKKNKIPYNYNS